MAESQNFHLAAKNYTQYEFKPDNIHMRHGGVYNQANIKPLTTTTEAFYTRGDRDASAGTEGSMSYISTDGTVEIGFSWDIPWGVGEDKLDVWVAKGPVKLEKTRFRGDDVLRRVVTIEIKDDLPLI